MKSLRLTLPVAILVLIAAATTAWSADDDSIHGGGQWPVAGHDLANSRNQPAEHLIDAGNVGNLSPAWTFTSQSFVSATPTVGNDALYFPDWAGNLYAVDKHTGRLIWSHPISDYDGVAGAISRVSPAIAGDDVILGDIESSTALHNGANVFAVNRHTGALDWITQVDWQPQAVITGSPVVDGDMVFEGISSIEEGLARNPGYPCCTFRGSMVALDVHSGAILWKTYDMPDNGGQPGGYSGGAIWQPPAVDPSRRMLFVGTGNNYSCPVVNGVTRCNDPNDHFDSALALDMDTGVIRWATGLESYDAWTVACLVGSRVNCPSPPGPDFDLGGSGPNLLQNMVSFGQKSGDYWMLDADSGRILWGTQVGPGGTLGGIEWGTATDGQRIYVAIGNNTHKPYPQNPSLTWGSWNALDPQTGRILWQTPDPTPGAIDTGSVSVANGVVYAGSYSGGMYALDASNGAILWSFPSGGSVNDGPAITSDGYVYWASGYGRLGGTNNNVVYAFTLTSPHP